MEEKYYYCMPQSGCEDFCFSRLGELDYEKYNEFIKNNEWIQKMKSNDIETNVEECCMGYGLCDLCRKCYRGSRNV